MSIRSFTEPGAFGPAAIVAPSEAFEELPKPIGAAGRLDALGQLLYGEHWITPMARDFKICQDTVAKWSSGKPELPPDHPIFAALAVLVQYHDKGVAKACAVMERLIGAQIALA